jgi:hypothetical protein
MKKILVAFTILLSVLSCSETKNISSSKKIKTETTTCQLIEKNFTHKGGKLTEYKELYLRCSIQDYFIKICEGNVTEEQLKSYLNKGIEVEMEIREGHLDHCEANPAYAQSRMGNYVVINKIIK